MEAGFSNKNKPIGFFDSGVGGLSVLKKAIDLMPQENYIYFGDSKNAPYGVREVEDIKDLSFKAIEMLLSRGSKAIVVACNTATSAAVGDLRKKYKDVPIIGIEPALKPAVSSYRKGKIMIMATPITLKERKFNNLVAKCGMNLQIVPIPCPGLVEMIEKGIFEGKDINDYLKDKFKNYIGEDISSIVLGCTHYPFIKKEIVSIFGENVPIIDGSQGTAKELKRRLTERDMLNDSIDKGSIEIINSSEEPKIIDLSYSLLKI